MRARLREIRLAPVVARPLGPLAALPHVAHRAGVVFGLVGKRRKLFDGQLEFAERERLDRRPMLRALIVETVFLSFRRTHVQTRPAGITTISGQPRHSRNTSPGFSVCSCAADNGACAGAGAHHKTESRIPSKDTARMFHPSVPDIRAFRRWFQRHVSKCPQSRTAGAPDSPALNPSRDRIRRRPPSRPRTGATCAAREIESAVVSEHLRQSAIGHRALIEIGADEHHAALAAAMRSISARVKRRLASLRPNRRPAPCTVE